MTVRLVDGEMTIMSNEKNELKPVQIKMVKWTPASPPKLALEFLNRPAILPEAEEAARKILNDIRERGDAAVV